MVRVLRALIGPMPENLYHQPKIVKTTEVIIQALVLGAIGYRVIHVVTAILCIYSIRKDALKRIIELADIH